MIVLGVDPGKTGALAWVDGDSTLLAVEDMPVVDGSVNAPLLAAYLVAREFDVAVVEDVHSMPKQGVASSFKFGVSKGVIIGILVAMDIPTHYVTPSVWKKGMGLSADKERSRKMALDRWPMSKELFRLKKHQDRAEAALMAVSYLNGHPGNILEPVALPANNVRRRLVRSKH